LSPEAWVKLSGHIAGTATSGLIGAMIGALLMAPGLFTLVASVALWVRGELRGARWRRAVAGMAVTALACLAVEFASDEFEYWFRLVVAGLAFLMLSLGVLSLPFAWWRGRGRVRPRPRGAAAAWNPPARTLARRPPRAIGPVIAAVVLLASAIPAALLKYRVFPEHLAWSAAEAGGLAVVAAPFAWLLGRYAFGRRRGSGFLVLAATVAMSGWLSLAGRWQLTRQAAAAMQEMAGLMRTLGKDEALVVKGADRWKYGPYAPMVQGMGRFYSSMRASLGTMDDLEPVLNEAAFRDVGEVRKTRARLEAFKERVRTIDADIGLSAGRLLADIEQSDAPDYMRAKMLQGVRSGLGHAPIRVTAEVKPMLDALEEVVAFMESRQGRYHYEDGQLVFDADADAVRFNRLVDGVWRLRSRAQADIARRRDRLKDTTAAFDEWAQDPFNRKPPDPEGGSPR
jgi:hypothetical protein